MTELPETERRSLRRQGLLYVWVGEIWNLLEAGVTFGTALLSHGDDRRHGRMDAAPVRKLAFTIERIAE